MTIKKVSIVSVPDSEEMFKVIGDDGTEIKVESIELTTIDGTKPLRAKLTVLVEKVENKTLYE